ncbi:hypothetical protein [Flexivirga meconopsidis]|uniref:hypothetical protein n=1 Tax=Flexivirga meconopsidis TaxID=2977121 RepID=UPI002240646F|nr:hypothetical protein [Flexivirga meconopsidis]
MASGGTDRAAALRRTYLSLGLGELCATAVFVGVALTGVVPSSAALWSALIPLVLVLLQGGVYWLLARRWLARGVMPRAVAAAYRSFRLLDPLVIAAGLVGVLVTQVSAEQRVLALMVWLLAVVEYVNYFVVRLAYPATSWLSKVGERRIPRLVKDIQASGS